MHQKYITIIVSVFIGYVKYNGEFFAIFLHINKENAMQMLTFPYDNDELMSISKKIYRNFRRGSSDSPLR